MTFDLDALAADYRRDGFCVLRGAITADELALLREETQAQIEAGPDREPRGDFMVRRTAAGPDLFFRIQTLHDRPIRNQSVLWLMAHPLILDLVDRIVGGADVVCFGNAMVWKGPDGGPNIDLHRDSRPTADWFMPDVVSPDVYLDGATPETGCLRVLPGSHLKPDVTEEVARGFDQELVDVVMDPGDVLFHDAMLLHGSAATPPGGPLRRVVYPTFQRADKLCREGVYPGATVSDEWIAQNIALLQHAARERRRSPIVDTHPFDYTVSPRWQEVVDRTPFVLRPYAGNLPWETGQMREQYLAQAPVTL